MCPAESRRRRARFIEHVATANESAHTQLVINGDFVDFLAEEALDSSAGGHLPFEPFTADPAVAVAKLERIMRRMDESADAGERIFPKLHCHQPCGCGCRGQAAGCK